MKIAKPALLALLLAILLATTEWQTRDVIAANKAHYAERLLREMVGDADLITTESGIEVRQAGELIGHIYNTTTDEGYNGEIELLVAVNLIPAVISTRVIRHQETPGLGDKIDRRVSDWIDGFSGRSLKNSEWHLQPAGDFDSITGATITSRATVDAVREVLEK